MANDATSTVTTPSAPTGHQGAGNAIGAYEFRQMIAVLDQLRSHTHTYTDDYTSNCQCNCGRGSL
jgi:hypothetical protein